MHVSVSDDTASLLEERMEGWVTGLRLAALSIGRESGLDRLVKNLTEHPYYVQKYLLEEVLSHVPPLFARYLMETSLLDRFAHRCAMCFEALQDTGNKVEEDLSGQAFIEWLETTHLFVIPLDETHEWFRYHHLFQQLLQHQLEQRRSVEETGRLHLLACEWFAEQGLLDEAIRHALAGEDVTEPSCWLKNTGAGKPECGSRVSPGKMAGAASRQGKNGATGTAPGSSLGLPLSI